MRRGHPTAGEMRDDFREHLGVFDRDRKVLLPDGFPVDAAELIDLFDELIDNLGRYGLPPIVWAFDTDFYGEWITITRIKLAIIVTGVIAKQIGVVAQVDISAAIRH